MTDIEAFFAMGGMGGYLWPAYAISAVVLGALVVVARRRLQRARRGEGA